MSKPFISICCITYNHVNYITKCLDGFLEQKGEFDYEILIHDDASTDGTDRIIKEYQAKYPEIIKPIFQSINQWSQGQRGMNARYNFGRAQGEYIALCEGDDYWIDNLKLQKQLNILEENKQFSACFTDARIVDQEGVIVMDTYCHFQESKPLGLKEVIENSGGFYPTASLFFRKNFNNLPSFTLNFTSGDRALALFLATKGKLYYIKEKTCSYRIHSGGAYTSIKDNTLERNKLRTENIELLKEFNSFTNYKYDNEFKKSISILSKLTLINLDKGRIEKKDRKLFKDLNLRDFFSFLYHYSKKVTFNNPSKNEGSGKLNNS